MSVTPRSWQRAQRMEKKYWQTRLAPDNFPANAMFARNYEYGNLTYSEALVEVVETIQRLRPIQAQDKILQIGCGPLDIINLWKGHQRYGMDPLIPFYRKTYPLPPDLSINDIPKKAEELGELDLSFDIILALNVLDHTEDLLSILRHLRKKLNHGGILYTLTNTWTGAGFMLRRLAYPLGVDRAHTYTLTKTNLECQMRGVGFKNVYSYQNEKACQYRLMRDSGVPILKLLSLFRIPVYPYTAAYKR